jgi:all-trans-retinol dehydrogenase (NAD+)
MPTGTPLSGATVLITGGGSGLGRRLALGAARRGSLVLIWDLDAERCAAVRDEIRADGGSAEAYVVDVTDRQAVKAAADVAGPVDVLVNNAGVVSGRPLLEAADEAIERTMNVNVMALYWVTRAFLGGMANRRRGTVVTVASAAGLVVLPARPTIPPASSPLSASTNHSVPSSAQEEPVSIRWWSALTTSTPGCSMASRPAGRCSSPSSRKSRWQPGSLTPSKPGAGNLSCRPL